MANKGSGPNVDFKDATVALWIMNTSGEMVDFSSLASNAADYIESINIKIGLMETFNLEIKLCPPLEKAIELIDTGRLGIGYDSKNFKKTNSAKPSASTGLLSSVKKAGKAIVSAALKPQLNKIAVQIFSSGKQSQVFKAYLMMPDVEVGAEGIDITLKGVGMLFFSTKGAAHEMAGDKEMFPLDVIKLWLGDKNTVSVRADTRAHAELTKKPMPFAQTTTPFEAAKHLLQDFNCHMYYKGAENAKDLQVVCIVHDEDRRNKIRYTFSAFKEIDPNNGHFPLLEFAPKYNNLMVMAAMHGARGVNVNKENKTAKQEDAGRKSYVEENTSKIPTKDGTAPTDPPAGDRNHSGEPSGAPDNDALSMYYGLITTGESFVNQVKGAVHSWMNRAFEFSAKSIGIADILPGEMVGINIADIYSLSSSGDPKDKTRIDGYDLRSVEHNISASGYEISLEMAAMGGLLNAASAGFEKASAAMKNKVGSIKESITDGLTS